MGWVPDEDGEVPGAEAQRALRMATARCRAIATQISMLQAELVDAAREVVELEGFLAGTTAAAHLAAECQLTGAESRRAVGLARRLSHLPSIKAAFTEGRLSEGTVVSLASVATSENEHKLLESAANANASQLQKLVSGYRKIKDHDEVDDGRPPPERLSYGLRGDGMWHISGRARPERGAEIEAALRAMDEVDAECLISPSEVHQRAGLSGDDLFAGGSLTDSVELDHDGNPIRPNDRRPIPADPPPEPVVVRQADVRPPGAMEKLVRLAQSLLAGKVTAAGVLPDRFLTVVHADADAPADASTLQGGGIVERDDVDEILCNSWVAAVLSRHGRPVDATSPLRDPPPAMRMALFARDEGCRFCGAAHFLHPHHIKQVIDRGKTALSNLVMLCGTCHRRLHDQGWRIDGDPNDPGVVLEWYRRDGSRIPVESLRRPRARKDPPPTPDGETTATRGPHNDQRLDRFATDVILHHWLQPPGAA